MIDKFRPASWILLLGAVLATGCAHTPGIAQTVPGGAYSSSVGRIFDTKCSSCHGGERAEARLRLDGHANVLAGSAFGQVVIPFDVGGSLLLSLVSGQAGMTPHPADREAETLSDEEFETLRAWVAAGAPDDMGNLPYTGDRDFIYVCNQGGASVSIIDAEAQVVVRTLDLQSLGFPASAKPHHVVVEPDGSFWYLTMIGANRVVKFNRDNEIVGSVEMQVPGLLALDPHSDRLFVGRSMSAVNPPQSIGQINRATMTMEEEIDVFFPRPHALALSPDGGKVYVASLAENRMITIDVASGDGVFTDIDGPVHTLVQFAANPVSGTVIAGGQMTAGLFTFDSREDGGLAVESESTVEGQPWHPVFSADGTTAYIPNKGSSGVTVWDTATSAVRTVIRGHGLAQPHGSALSRDGRYLFVSNTNMEGTFHPRYHMGSMADHSGMNEMPGMSGMSTMPGTVVVIDTDTNEIVKVIEIGMSPSGMGSRGPYGVR